MKKLLIILSLLILHSSVHSQTVEQLIESGNNFYKLQQFEQAEAEFRKALKIAPDNSIAKFNLANTLVRRNKQTESTNFFDDIYTKEPAIDLRSKSTYNKGVVFSKQKKLEESIEAYKNALRLNPDDEQARENLQKALMELKKKPPPKKEDDKKKQQKQQDKKQQQKPQSKMNQKEAEQKLKLLEQKEKEAQQRLQKEKTKGGVPQPKDW